MFRINLKNHIYIYIQAILIRLSKKVWKLSLRQHREMEKQRWKEPEKKREVKIREEKEDKKENASAGQGRKVAIHCVFCMICGSRGSKNRLAKGGIWLDER